MVFGQGKTADQVIQIVRKLADRNDRVLVTRVTPEMVAPDSPLYSIGGTSSYVQFELDVLPGLGIVESNPGPDTTAYGLLADFINAVRE